jgi:hypothetical protein
MALKRLQLAGSFNKNGFGQRLYPTWVGLFTVNYSLASPEQQYIAW